MYFKCCKLFVIIGSFLHWYSGGGQGNPGTGSVHWYQRLVSHLIQHSLSTPQPPLPLDPNMVCQSPLVWAQIYSCLPNIIHPCSREVTRNILQGHSSHSYWVDVMCFQNYFQERVLSIQTQYAHPFPHLHIT